MKKLLLPFLASLSLCAEEENTINVRLQGLEHYEIKKSNQPYVLLHDAACNIRTTLERIIGLLPKAEIPFSLELIKQRIDLGYITAPLNVIKEAIESAYNAVVEQITSTLTPQESEQLRSSLQNYYDSISCGDFNILLSETPTDPASQQEEK